MFPGHTIHCDQKLERKCQLAYNRLIMQVDGQLCLCQSCQGVSLGRVTSQKSSPVTRLDPPKPSQIKPSPPPDTPQLDSSTESGTPNPLTIALSYPEASPELRHTVGVIVKIGNSSSLETWAREQELNPNPGSPWATGPVDRRTARPRISEIKPPQADAENIGPCSETGQTKEIIAPDRRLITAPNVGTEAATISFMNLKSTPATNQELTQERGTGPSPVP
ncbi:hypothetical protein DSO57_1030977 [Entomophthora muscae]|uniref:Uncharacterized protein n=1 Tax=Entomophthora muscae TaxID=34485 RepID=A0ACC2S2W5_9FUNG|nr:hypothetical protein DSO57_1030977 [Entomophthora muscae]